MSSSRSELTVNQKKTIINLIEGNFSQFLSYIADLLKVSQSYISKFLKRWNCRSNVENLCQSGRQRKSTDI